MTIRMVVSPNGPLIVGGDLGALQLTGPDGAAIPLGDEKKIFLCRCGASTTKPFCDGTHSKIGFQAAEAAVAAGG